MAIACGASSVYQYGSVATGTAIPSSDLDLMIVSESLDTIDLELFAATIAGQPWAVDVKCVAHTQFPVVKVCLFYLPLHFKKNPANDLTCPPHILTF